MFIHAEIFDRVAWVPGWPVLIAFGVLIGWLRWRSPWRRR